MKTAQTSQIGLYVGITSLLVLMCFGVIVMMAFGSGVLN